MGETRAGMGPGLFVLQPSLDNRQFGSGEPDARLNAQSGRACCDRAAVSRNKAQLSRGRTAEPAKAAQLGAASSTTMVQSGTCSFIY